MNIPKYRVWHKQLKKMLPVLEINLDPEFGGVFVWGKAYYDADTGEHEADKDFWPQDDIELMQWTGLTDEKGKDIYEGDILQFTHLYGDKENVQVMWGIVPVDNIWSRAETWIVSRFRNGMEGALYPYCQHPSYSTIALVGNIWQHPELLGGQQP